MTVATILAESEMDGVEIIPLDSDELQIQGWNEESRRWLPVIEDHAREILDYLRRHQARTALDAVRIAEAILADARRPKRARRKRGAK